MLPRQASQSMVRTATRRAAHQLLDHPRIFCDPLAVGFVPEASEQAIRAAADEHRTSAMTLMRSLFALRSRFAEDRLAAAARFRGATQYVMVGAGLDTFPWRQPEWAQGMQIFWVDHPVSLQWSTACLRERGLTVPPNLTFVAADLEQQQLAGRLAEHSFDDDAISFCTVLGVTQYISRAAVEELFGLVAAWQVHSEIVCSFALPDAELDGDDLAAAIRSVAATDTSGEPWKTRLAVSDVFGLLTRFGFGEVSHLTPKRARQQYFFGRRDMLRVPRLEQLFAATV